MAILKLGEGVCTLPTESTAVDSRDVLSVLAAVVLSDESGAERWGAGRGGAGRGGGAGTKYCKKTYNFENAGVCGGLAIKYSYNTLVRF